MENAAANVGIGSIRAVGHGSRYPGYGSWAWPGYPHGVYPGRWLAMMETAAANVGIGMVGPGWPGWAIRMARIGLGARTGSRKKVKKVASGRPGTSRTSPCLGVENIGHTLPRKKR